MEIGVLKKRYDALKAIRVPYENYWRQINEFVFPARGDRFIQKDMSNMPEYGRVFDTTAPQSAEMLAATLHSGLTNPSTNWFGLSIADMRLRENEDVQRFLKKAQEEMMRVFSSPDSSFVPQVHEFYLDLAGFGTAVLYVEDKDGEIVFQSKHLSQVYVSENHQGLVDTVFAQYKMTIRQIVQKFGEDALPKNMKNRLKTDPECELVVVHAVFPRKDVELGRSKKKLPFASIYFLEDGDTILSESGYHEMPYLVARWSKKVGDVYGYGPGWTALPDILMVNKMRETTIKTAQKSAEPPLLVADDGVIMPIRMTPGGITYGGIDPVTGRPRIQPFQSGANFNVSLEMIAATQKSIRDIFYVDQLVFRDGPALTATEVMQRQEENLRLLGPQLGRAQSEFQTRLIDRVFMIMLRNGQLGDIPNELAGVDLKIEFTNPLQRLQKQEQIVGIQRTLQSVMPFLEQDPSLLDTFDKDAMIRYIADVNGVPIDLIRSRADVEAERQQQQQMMQAQQEAMMMQQMASAGKDAGSMINSLGGLDGGGQ